MRKAFNGFFDERFEIKAWDQFAAGGLDAGFAHVKNLAGETEKFPRRQFVVKERKIGNISETATGFERIGLDIESGKPRSAGTGFEEAGKKFDESRFAGGVGAEHGKKFAAGNGQAQIVDGD